MPPISLHSKLPSAALREMFGLAERGLTKPLAEVILTLDFTDHEASRIDELGDKANEGTLSGGEQAELEAYVEATDLLAYWQAVARHFLHPIDE